MSLFYLGGDLSYVNEMEDLGAVYHDDGHAADPFAIFKKHGANIVRVRLWHTPTWTAYSNLADVKKTIRRAKAQGMHVMLDFHYSDTWADPAKQIIPEAWAWITDPDDLTRAVHDYTLGVLIDLHGEGLMPDIVQVGNEINTELLMPGPCGENPPPINWERNAKLINAGIQGVRDAGVQTGTHPQVMLHIAQPENLLGWFDAALSAGVGVFDLIGMSYYPKWSKHNLAETGAILGLARERYGVDIVIVEAAYPFTLDAGKAESHLIAEDCILPDYPGTPEGQRQFLTDLAQTTLDYGGKGVIYWEPAWVSAPQRASIWENATLFDYENNVHEGMAFLSHPYRILKTEE